MDFFEVNGFWNLLRGGALFFDGLRTRENMNARLATVQYQNVHCFTYECLNSILNIFYDFVNVKKMLYDHCVCYQLINSRCECCLEHVVRSWRSFNF